MRFAIAINPSASRYQSNDCICNLHVNRLATGDV